MKLKSGALLVAMAAMACFDGGPGLVDSQIPSLAVSDGEHGGNEHFFFLPPLVPTPSHFNGTFNGSLTPTVEVHLLLDTLDVRCAPTTTPIVTFTNVSADSVAEAYQVNWQTGASNLTSHQAYRICVSTYGRELGYRDIRPDDSGADVPRNPDQLPTLEFNNGSNLPIKFRIENLALCSRGVIDCTETVLGPEGGTAVCDNEFCGLEIQPNAVEQNFLFIVELLQCPTNSAGRVNFINTDIPQFGGCMEITIEPEEEFSGLAIGGLAGACLNATGLPHDQEERIQLHHEKSDGTVEALPNAAAPFVNCTDYVAMSNGASKLGLLARRAWREVRDLASPWFAPAGVAAIDRGLGGTGFNGASPFVWALPSQMEQVGWTNPETGEVGDVVNPTVLVTDAGGDPVQNATVTFDVQVGNGPPTSPVPVLTNALGQASAPWTLGPTGLLLLEASGHGIGLTASADGRYIDYTPPGGSGVFADHYNAVVNQGTGVLNFEAVVCEAGASPLVDGSVGAAEYANSESFSANISGGSGAPATVSWTNDCENLYLAVAVTASDEVTNDLRFVFDNDGDGLPAAGDDALLFEKTKSGARVFHDRYRPDKCNGQSDCTIDDPGLADGTGVFHYDPSTGVSTYEVVHPLRSGDAAHDFQLTFGDTAGFYLVLQLGNGAQGNTEWRGHDNYIPVTIAVP